MKSNQPKNLRVQYMDKGLIEYQKAWNQQEALFDQIVAVKEANRNSGSPELTPNFLIFCSHPHVYTLGKSGDESNLLINKELQETVGEQTVLFMLLF